MTATRSTLIRDSELLKRRSNIPSIVGAIMASGTTGGTSYAFGLYSSALKRSLQLSQSQLDTISTFFFVAGLLSFIPGYCSDRFGTRFALTVGGCTSATALITYWLVATQYIVVEHAFLVPVLSFLGVAIFLSSALITGGVFKIISVCCGPGTKGSAVGVAKGYVGLGAGLYACLFESLRGPGSSDLDFLPMAAFFSIMCVTVPGLILLPTKARVEMDVFHDDITPSHMRILFASLFLLAVMIIGNSLLSLSEPSATDVLVLGDENVGSVEGERSHYGAALIMLSIWAGPIMTLLYLPRAENITDPVLSAEMDDDESYDMSDSSAEGIETDEERAINDNVRRRASKDSCIEMSSSQSSKDGQDRKTTKRSNSGKEMSAVKRNEEARTLLGGLKHQSRKDDNPDVKHSNNNGETNDTPDKNQIESDVNENVTDEIVDSPDKNLFQMLQTPSALLMLYTTTILVGGGTVITNNMGQMVESLSFPDKVTPAALAIFSVAQAGGRIATGAISESALTWRTRAFRFVGIDYGVPRPFFLVAAAIVGVFAHIVMGFAETKFFFVLGSALAGIAFGMNWPLMVLVTGEVFGTENVGANYMFYDGFTSAAGTLLLSKLIAQEVYESHINVETAPDPYTCIGTGCFEATHLIVSALSASCIATSMGMVYASRHIYNKQCIR